MAVPTLIGMSAGMLVGSVFGKNKIDTITNIVNESITNVLVKNNTICSSSDLIEQKVNVCGEVIENVKINVDANSKNYLDCKIKNFTKTNVANDIINEIKGQIEQKAGLLSNFLTKTMEQEFKTNLENTINTNITYETISEIINQTIINQSVQVGGTAQCFVMSDGIHGYTNPNMIISPDIIDPKDRNKFCDYADNRINDAPRKYTTTLDSKWNKWSAGKVKMLYDAACNRGGDLTGFLGYKKGQSKSYYEQYLNDASETLKTMSVNYGEASKSQLCCTNTTKKVKNVDITISSFTDTMSKVVTENKNIIDIINKTSNDLKLKTAQSAKGLSLLLLLMIVLVCVIGGFGVAFLYAKYGNKTASTAIVV